MKVTRIIPINKAIALLALILLTSTVFIFSKTNQNKKEQEPKEYKVQTFKTNTGWGYKIFSSEKILINQENIPAVSGMISFKSENEAMVTANLAVEKIKMGLFPPTITIEELDSLNVSY